MNDLMQLQRLFDARQREHEEEIAASFVAIWQEQQARRDAQVLVLALMFGKVEGGKVNG